MNNNKLIVSFMEFSIKNIKIIQKWEMTITTVKASVPFMVEQ